MVCSEWAGATRQPSLHALGLDLIAVADRGCSATVGLGLIAVAARRGANGTSSLQTVAPRRGLRAGMSGVRLPDLAESTLDVEVARERPEQVLAVGDEQRAACAATNRPPWICDAQAATDMTKATSVANQEGAAQQNK